MDSLLAGIRSELAPLTLNEVESRDGGREVVASYHLSRPVAGWATFGVAPILSTVSGSVTDLREGRLFRQDIGTLEIKVAPSTVLSGVLLGFPELTSSLVATTDIQLRFDANFDLREIKLDGTELRVALPLAGDQQFDTDFGYALVSVLAIDPENNGQTLTVTYRLTPPSAGWGSGNRAAIAYAPLTLGHDADLTPWVGVGSLSLRPSFGFTATVLSDPIDAPVAKHSFQVLFEHRSQPIDIALLERTQVRVGYLWSATANGQLAGSRAT